MILVEKLPLALAIDAGNTRTKWALFDEAGKVCSQGVCLNSDLPSTEFFKIGTTCDRVVISNVAGAEIGALLQTKCLNLGLIVHWAVSSGEACHVKNNYDYPSQLGSDRWAALIAAWHIVHAPCVVVNVGTAATIDALTFNDDGVMFLDGLFLGGLILPGLRLMQQALVQGADGITITSGNLDSFPTNTANAVHTGACLAIVGAITQVIHQLEVHCATKPKIILSGGDAALLMPLLLNQLNCDFSEQVILCENLVLQGLYLLDKN